MERMLDEYLDFARGEGGEKAQLADLGDLVRDAAAAAAARARRRRSASHARNARAACCLSVKANALRRCVTNLIDNAFKHGRQVRVSLRRASALCRNPCRR